MNRVRVTPVIGLIVSVIVCLGWPCTVGAADAKHTFAFAAKDQPGLAKRAEDLVKLNPDAVTTSDTIKSFRDAIVANKTLQPDQPARWVGGSKGNVVGIYVIYFHGEKQPPSIGWTEEVRDSLFVSGLKTVVQLAGKISGLAAPADTALVMTKEAHVLQEERGTVTIDVPTEKARNTSTLTDAVPDYVVIVDLTTDQEPNKHAAQEFVLLTGPREAFFWTADLPVNRVKQLKLDDKGAITPQDESPSFYAGLDYTFGDAASPPTQFMDALAIKTMVKGSRRPLDSVGIALALRAGYLNNAFGGRPGKLGLDLSAFSPFVGVTSTRQDKEASGGVVTKTGRKSEFRAGVGFDIGAALKWVKKPSGAGGSGDTSSGGAGQPATPQPTNPNPTGNTEIPKPQP